MSVRGYGSKTTKAHRPRATKASATASDSIDVYGEEGLTLEKASADEETEKAEQTSTILRVTNYAMDSENRLTVVLVGHLELRRRMSMAALDALAQRIVVRAHVRGLARDEMGPYLAHRLRLAGTEVPLFEPPTVEAIFQASSGLPRKANGLAHHALFAAAIAKAKSVTTEHVQAAMQEVA